MADDTILTEAERTELVQGAGAIEGGDVARLLRGVTTLAALYKRGAVLAQALPASQRRLAALEAATAQVQADHDALVAKLTEAHSRKVSDMLAAIADLEARTTAAEARFVAARDQADAEERRATEARALREKLTAV